MIIDCDIKSYTKNGKTKISLMLVPADGSVGLIIEVENPTLLKNYITNK